MTVFNVCANYTMQLYNGINSHVEELLVMSFDWSCDSHQCCDWWFSVYCYGTNFNMSVK